MTPEHTALFGFSVAWVAGLLGYLLGRLHARRPAAQRVSLEVVIEGHTAPPGSSVPAPREMPWRYPFDQENDAGRTP